MKKSMIIVCVSTAAIAALLLLGISLYNKDKPCITDWECSDWNSCIKSVQARNCIDKNKCGTVEDKPIVVQHCNMKCFDLLQNQNEEDVDCGGVCESCELKLAPAKKNRTITYIVLTLLCGILGSFIYSRGKNELGIFRKGIRGSAALFRSRLKDTGQGIQIREAATDPRLNQIQDYIRRCIASGYGYQAIKQSLITNGWPEQLIDEAFEDINNIRIGV